MASLSLTDQFTKQEAIELLGRTVEFKETVYIEAAGVKYPSIKAGTQCSVYLIENKPDGIELGLLVDFDYRFFNKLGFNYYCQVMPEADDHACAG